MPPESQISTVEQHSHVCETMQVAEALHEQIADLSNLVAELEREHLQHRNSLDMEELEGISGTGLGSYGLSVSSQEMNQGRRAEDTVTPYSDSPILGGKSVSVRQKSDASVRSSSATAGA